MDAKDAKSSGRSEITDGGNKRFRSSGTAANHMGRAANHAHTD